MHKTVTCCKLVKLVATEGLEQGTCARRLWCYKPEHGNVQACICEIWGSYRNTGELPSPPGYDDVSWGK